MNMMKQLIITTVLHIECLSCFNAYFCFSTYLFDYFNFAPDIIAWFRPLRISEVYYYLHVPAEGRRQGVGQGDGHLVA